MMNNLGQALAGSCVVVFPGGNAAIHSVSCPKLASGDEAAVSERPKFASKWRCIVHAPPRIFSEEITGALVLIAWPGMREELEEFNV